MAASRGASFAAQTAAVLRSNASLQRRALWTNLCLLVLPLAFCGLLFGLQLAINGALDSRQFRCGCKCLACCEWVKPPGARQAEYQCWRSSQQRPCSPYAACSTYDDSTCGFQYSTFQQVAFCPVQEPPVWPPLAQVPLAKYRNAQLQEDGKLQEPSSSSGGSNLNSTAGSNSTEQEPPLLLAYTGTDSQLAGRLMSRLLARNASLSTQLLTTLLRSPLAGQQGTTGQAGLANLDLCAPGVTASSLQQLLANTTASNTSAAGGSAGNGNDMAQAAQLLTQMVSDLGLVLGTAAPTSPTNYLEPAFIARSAALDTQSGSAGSSAGGLGGFAGPSGSAAPSLAAEVEVRPLYFLTGNCSALAPADQRVLQQLGCALDVLLGVPLKCASAVPQWRPDWQQLQREIFCGWVGSSCKAVDSGSIQPLRLTTDQVDSAIGQWPSLLLDWRNTSAGGLDLAVMANRTFTSPATGLAPQLQRWALPLNLATSAYLQEMQASSSNTSSGPSGWSLRLAGLKGFPFRGGALRVDFAALLGPLFFMWLLQLLLPVYVAQLVGAKERGSRTLLALQGLGDGAYLAATWAWQMALYCGFLVVLVGGGSALGLKLFTLNDYGVQLVFYLLWGCLMVAWAYYISAVMASTQAAVIWAVSINVFSGLIANLVMVQFVQYGPAWLALVLQLLPSFGLYRGLWELSQYAFLADANSGMGLTWAKLRDPGNDMLLLWGIFAAETLWIGVCAWYLEQVLGSGPTGVRRHPFFLMGFKYEDEGQQAAKSARSGSIRAGLLRAWLVGRRQATQPAAGTMAPAAVAVDMEGDLGAPNVPPGGAGAVQQLELELQPHPGPLPPVAGTVHVALSVAAASHTGSDIQDGNAAEAVDQQRGAKNDTAAVDVAAEAAAAEECYLQHQQDPLAYQQLWHQQQQDLERQEAVAAAAAGSGGQRAGYVLPAGWPASVPALLVHRLFKTYPSQDGRPPKEAVRGLSLQVASRECLALLGPNGAGKSTSLSLMQGQLAPTSGAVLVAGRDLRAEPAAARRLVGVCPQHDVLWDKLTAREHLLLYCRLKGLRGEQLQESVQRALREVGLEDAADKVAGACSGGMRRRLSVAIAMTGRPAVVFLDEPSTGLDPTSRHLLWQVVRSAAHRHALVLTTHSMEEARALCSRIGIFVAGRLRCIGTPQELTARFGGCLTLSLTTPPHQELLAREVVSAMCPSARAAYCLSGTQRFELPVQDIGLAQVFSRMQALAAAGGDESGARDEQHQHQHQLRQKQLAALGAPSTDTDGSLVDPGHRCGEIGAGLVAQREQDQCQQAGGKGTCERLQLLNWGVSNATLEQVFLKVVALAEAEAADVK